MSEKYSIYIPLPKKLEDFDSDQLEITLIASHTNRLINARKYLSSEFIKQLNTWTTPYQRPVLVHHNDYADQIGRVTEQYYGNKEYLSQVLGTEINFPPDQDGAIALKAYITDQAAINKIKNGVYTTVSIGFMQDELICSYCGQPVGECMHTPGQKIDGEMVYSIPRGITFEEVSFVNKPADDHAGIVNIKPVDLNTALQKVNTQPLQRGQNSNTTQIGYQQATNSQEHITVDSEDQLQYNPIRIDGHQSVQTQHEQPSKEASSMNEVKDSVTETADSQYKSELQKVTNELKAVTAERDKLKETVQKLNDMLKSELVSKVVNKKMLLLEQNDDETEQKLVAEYTNMSIDQLLVLDKEYSGLVDSLFDELEQCENCESEDSQQLEPIIKPDTTVKPEQEKEPKKEEPATEQSKTEEPAKDQQVAQQVTQEDSTQGIKKVESPLGTTVLDQFESVKKILGLK